MTLLLKPASLLHFWAKATSLWSADHQLTISWRSAGDQLAIRHWSAGDGRWDRPSCCLWWALLQGDVFVLKHLDQTATRSDSVLCLWSETSWLQGRLSLCPPVCPVSRLLKNWRTWRSGWMFYALIFMSSVRSTGPPWRRVQHAVDACCPGNGERSTSSCLTKSPLDRRHHVWLLKRLLTCCHCSFPIVMTIVTPRMHLSLSAEGCLGQSKASTCQ